MHGAENGTEGTCQDFGLHPEERSGAWSLCQSISKISPALKTFKTGVGNLKATNLLTRFLGALLLIGSGLVWQHFGPGGAQDSTQRKHDQVGTLTEHAQTSQPAGMDHTELLGPDLT